MLIEERTIKSKLNVDSYNWFPTQFKFHAFVFFTWKIMVVLTSKNVWLSIKHWLIELCHYFSLNVVNL